MIGRRGGRRGGDLGSQAVPTFAFVMSALVIAKERLEAQPAIPEVAWLQARVLAMKRVLEEMGGDLYRTNDPLWTQLAANALALAGEVALFGQ